MHTTPDAAAPVSDTPVPWSIRLLRRLNPVIIAVLCSPLHGLLSANLLVLGYTGRRTGRRYRLPLSYVERDGRLYLCTRTAFWWRNLRRGRPVELRLRGRDVVATPSILDPSSPEALEGLRAFLTRNPGTGELLYNVPRGPDGRPVEADLRREVLRSVVVRLERR
jgi:hypothetical protein